MDSYASFTHRLGETFPFLGFWFVAGLVIAIWNPGHMLILTVSLGITLAILVVGPYSAALLYLLRLQHILGGYLRLPVCALLAVTVVLIVDHIVSWSALELAVACVVVVGGAIIGHDGALATLEIREFGRESPDYLMVLVFPVATGLAALAGYCSLGFGAGTYRLLAAVLS
tara:strand:- start:993 stop:1505 length:513 start_codon:yes stop_codon:yes gene_type:complete